jgi:hypothetical protein
MIKAERMRGLWHTTVTGEIINGFTILLVENLREDTIGKSKCNCGDNIEIDLQENKVRLCGVL